jgi:hypothetical protein
MSDRAKSEGIRVLEDFVCEAILDPATATGSERAAGRNEGIQIAGELTIPASGGKSHPDDNLAKGTIIPGSFSPDQRDIRRVIDDLAAYIEPRKIRPRQRRWSFRRSCRP